MRDRQSVVTMALSAFNVVVANVAAWLWTRRSGGSRFRGCPMSVVDA